MAVPLHLITKSNNLIGSVLPQNLVAVVFGGTSGIGEATVKKLASYAKSPTIFIVGRSHTSFDRIVSEVKTINPDALLSFFSGDVSLLKDTDRVCADIADSLPVQQDGSKKINILILSAGQVFFSPVQTAEGTHKMISILFHSRTRITLNLLPHLSAASSLNELARVVSVGAAGKEGPVVVNDLGFHNSTAAKLRAHLASLMTLSFVRISKLPAARAVTFIHTFPGFVKTALLRTSDSVGMVDYTLRLVFQSLSSLAASVLALSAEESAERHIFMATSAMYPPRNGSPNAPISGVPVPSGFDHAGVPTIARGLDSEPGSGLYDVLWNCSTVGPQIEKVVKQFVTDGTEEKIWQFYLAEMSRIGLNPAAPDNLDRTTQTANPDGTQTGN